MYSMYGTYTYMCTYIHVYLLFFLLLSSYVRTYVQAAVVWLCDVLMPTENNFGTYVPLPAVTSCDKGKSALGNLAGHHIVVVSPSTLQNS